MRLLLAVARKHEKGALLGTVRKTRELPEGLVENPQGRRGYRLIGLVTPALQAGDPGSSPGIPTNMLGSSKWFRRLASQASNAGFKSRTE